jgi:AraC-like DNA-binding protein/mannose-6-phosphate isomerase-like protein (cupin superfamily)
MGLAAKGERLQGRATTRPLRFVADPDATKVLIDVQPLDRHHVVKSMAAHSHQFLEVVFFETGGGTHQIGARSHGIEAGHVHCVPLGEVHDLGDIGDATGWIALFSPDAVHSEHRGGIGDWFAWTLHPLLRVFANHSDPDGSVFEIDQNDRARWSQRFGAIQRELNNPRFGSVLAARSLLSLVLIDLTRLAKTQPISEKDEGFVFGVFQWISENYSQSWKLSDVANQMNMSQNYLSALIKKATGRPVSVWVNECRMAEARRLLLRGMPVGNVAGLVGFLDQTQFSRQFAAMHGTTPKRWSLLAANHR